MKTDLNELKLNNKGWFTKGNKAFFGDINYRVLHSENKPYLVRLTNAWTDMFDGVKKPHYKINEINNDLSIGHLFDNEFKTIEEVKRFLK